MVGGGHTPLSSPCSSWEHSWASRLALRHRGRWREDRVSDPQLPGGEAAQGAGEPSRWPVPHQRKSDSRHLHTRDSSADVKLRPLMHQDVDFLFRKLLCWPMMQRSPCHGNAGEDRPRRAIALQWLGLLFMPVPRK